MSTSKVSCCIRGCSNMPYKNKNNTQLKFYRFPESSMNTAWVIFRRQKWINAVKNHVKHPKDWEPNKNTRICSAHFINNQKSENPLRGSTYVDYVRWVSYIPTIFPNKENTKRSTQSLQRFQRLQQRESRSKKNNEIINNNNNNSGIDNSDKTVSVVCEDHNSFEVELQNVEISHVSNTISKAASRSITCQTDELINGIIFDEHIYIFCNINTCDGVSTAEVQVNLPIKKTAEKMCDVNLPPLQKSVQDMGCDPINQDSIKQNCHGFHN